MLWLSHEKKERKKKKKVNISNSSQHVGFQAWHVTWKGNSKRRIKLWPEYCAVSKWIILTWQLLFNIFNNFIIVISSRDISLEEFSGACHKFPTKLNLSHKHLCITLKNPFLLIFSSLFLWNTNKFESKIAYKSIWFMNV